MTKDFMSAEIQNILNKYDIEVCEVTHAKAPKTMILRTPERPPIGLLKDYAKALGEDWKVFWEQADIQKIDWGTSVTNEPNMVAHPPHYNSGKIEVIEFIFDQGFGPEFCKGNALKYISRAGKKAGVDEIQDLEKAGWYVDYLVERLKAEKENREPKRPNQLRQK